MNDSVTHPQTQQKLTHMLTWAIAPKGAEACRKILEPQLQATKDARNAWIFAHAGNYDAISTWLQNANIAQCDYCEIIRLPVALREDDMRSLAVCQEKMLVAINDRLSSLPNGKLDIAILESGPVPLRLVFFDVIDRLWRDILDHSNRQPWLALSCYLVSCAQSQITISAIALDKMERLRRIIENSGNTSPGTAHIQAAASQIVFAGDDMVKLKAKLEDIAPKLRRDLEHLAKPPMQPPHPLTVMLRGEAGCGLSTVARYLHSLIYADQPTAPCQEIDCSCLPPTLARGLLLGWSKGAFTDAVDDCRGLLAQDGGTIIISHLECAPKEVQSIFLRALQERSFFKLGAKLEAHEKPQYITAQIIVCVHDRERFARDVIPDLRYRCEGMILDIPTTVSSRERLALAAEASRRYGVRIDLEHSQIKGLLQTAQKSRGEIIRAVEKAAFLSLGLHRTTNPSGTPPSLPLFLLAQALGVETTTTEKARTLVHWLPPHNRPGAPCQDLFSLLIEKMPNLRRVFLIQGEGCEAEAEQAMRLLEERRIEFAISDPLPTGAGNEKFDIDALCAATEWLVPRLAGCEGAVASVSSTIGPRYLWWQMRRCGLLSALVRVNRSSEVVFENTSAAYERYVAYLLGFTHADDWLAWDKGKSSRLWRGLASASETVFLARCTARYWRITEHIDGCAPVVIFIHGETGSGKELHAKLFSKEFFSCLGTEEKFVYRSLAELDDNLMVSELFGHVKGSYTGATQNKIGLVEKAHNGILFLDEIGRISALSSMKLVEFMQSGYYRPLGSAQMQHARLVLLVASSQTVDDFQRDPDKKILARALQNILDRIRLEVSQWEERPLEWRRNIILDFFEERGIARQAVDKSVVETLTRAKYPGNVRQVEAIVHVCALHAWLKGEHLPQVEDEIKKRGGVTSIRHENGIGRRILTAIAQGHGFNEARRILGLRDHTKGNLRLKAFLAMLMAHKIENIEPDDVVKALRHVADRRILKKFSHIADNERMRKDWQKAWLAAREYLQPPPPDGDIAEYCQRGRELFNKALTEALDSLTKVSSCADERISDGS